MYARRAVLWPVSKVGNVGRCVTKYGCAFAARGWPDTFRPRRSPVARFLSPPFLDFVSQILSENGAARIATTFEVHSALTLTPLKPPKENPNTA